MSAPSSRATSLQEAALPDIAQAVRRVISARVRDRETVDDLAQEALTRVLEAGPRLDDATLLPYAVVTARNLVVSWVRGEDRRRRHQHRLVELHGPPTPDEEVLRQEEKRAVSAALSRLPERDRVAVVAHDGEGTDTTTLAHELESTPGGVAVRLARAHARLRVGYLLIQGVHLVVAGNNLQRP